MQLQSLAKTWERKLYQQAHSFEDYVDNSTFRERVESLSRSTNKTQEQLNRGVNFQHHFRLHLLRHAISCKEEVCTVTPFCASIRNVASHMEGCNEMHNCQVPFCYTLKMLMHHSRHCRDGNCLICEPTIRHHGCVFCQDEQRNNNQRAVENPSYRYSYQRQRS